MNLRRNVTKALLAATALTIAACAPVGEAQRLDVPSASTVPMRPYEPGRPNPYPASRANTDMVRDFLELGFAMESGRPIEHFSRFEGPVNVITQGNVPAQALGDLDRLLRRLQTEARVDIRRRPAAQVGETTNTITVEFMPRRQMQSVVPQAACFVVPNVSSWREFVANRRSPAIDWTRVVQRSKAAVFVPEDTTPQEVRDCLHEEIGQALGPLNDLFRLPDSIFNDDNFQTTLTGFDMLLLRVWYSADLTPGMTRTQVATRLPTLFNRLNPAGRRGSAGDPGITPRAWQLAVEQALASGGSTNARRTGAGRALSLARARGWDDSRLALSLMLTARLAPANQGEAALQSMLNAAHIYRGTPGGEVHAAHLDMHLAVQALATGHTDLVMELTDRAREPAARSENAAFVASLGFIRAEALAQMGQLSAAEQLRLDSLAAARYGFGSERAARGRMQEIARISQAATRTAGL